MPGSSDKWAAGVTYEDFMGRCSRLLAPRFVSCLGVRPNPHWLDVGCGTGALTRFSSFAELWTPFLGGPAPSYVAGLEPRRREALAEHLDRSLPRDPDGAISLAARAWVVSGAVRANGP
jgi:hypothetical protein